MTKRFLTALVVGVAVVAISACGGDTVEGSSGFTKAQADPVESLTRVSQVEAYEPPVTSRTGGASAESAKSASEVDRPAPFAVKLPPLPSVQRAAEARAKPGTPGVPVEIGVAREVTMTADSEAMSRALQWKRGQSRTAAAVSFTSEGAAGIRLGLLVRKLPVDAVVRGYVQGGNTTFEIAGRTILDAVQRNRDAGDLTDAGRTYWTPVVENEEVTLEIALPPGTSPDVVDVSVPQLSHLYVKSEDLNRPKIGESGSCEIDVSCVSEADPQSRSTARMSFIVNGGSYLCTGTLMNNTSSSGAPYFLSANHCISSQTAASSLITYWFYRSPSCNSLTLSSSARKLSSGATLLYASSQTDTSFLRLNESPPDGAVFSGWSSTVPSTGADIVGIHHPQGDLQKYSRGAVAGFAKCTGTSCSSSTEAAGSFLSSMWSAGTTEGGSSGSGIWALSGSKRYLVGQLFAGSASCSNLRGTDRYGRFDLAYSAALNRWLSPTSSIVPRTAIYRFYNATTGAHFFTSSSAERDWVVGNASFKYEGIAFYAYGSQVSGSSPVYRFYNTRTGRHFYTISATERDIVLDTNKDYSFEGTSWFAQEGNGGTATAVYRFYNAGFGTHFYSISAAEKDAIVQSNPAYKLEGVGYYAWTTQ